MLSETGKTCEVFSLDGESSIDLREELLMARLEAICAGREYRERTDLQATERALISSIAPLCGNSARGGYRHEPDLASLGSVSLPPFDEPDATTAATLERIDENVERHLRDAKVYLG